MTIIAATPAERTRTLAALALVGSAACWGLATVASRSLLERLPSTTLLLIQLPASMLLLTILASRESRRQAAWPRLLRAAWPGVLEPGLAYAIGLAGLSLTSAGHAAVIGSAEPMFIVLLGWLLLGQRPDSRLIACLLATMLGLLLISTQGAETGGSTTSLTGDLLIVLATLLAAGYVLASAKLAGHHPPASLALVQQGAGLLFVLVLQAVLVSAGLASPPWAELDAALVAQAALSGVLQYALPFWLYLIGLRWLNAASAGLYLALIPVFGLMAAFVWLGERPTPGMLLGAALILTVVVLGRRHA
ncbi:DMT family transporter [Pseudomonas oryzihabitans]|uniref:Drug/metabolite transporter (DMT)-like permease n=1 Tax=Pseudomonas oryzihabitans TaxID=47885 RepID=A0AAJ2BIE1_9PSED|nr:DMT family transporter [Pseudomonas psychrotolerans]MDR6233330.1 drug/metabolite transporter (DMT)-like permease [Pseudomonas psychrotolerans]MDR6357651.1 drug/metabolite transporter (DMT)-like permease [Pseudomonas psychrotolerans]MDR6679206.1 drug/metabolite transporter (DMT)-like permease [Pseudomonas psychrotolerans]